MAFKCQRWTIANILPVGFMLGMISVIWMLYMWLHILPLLDGQVGYASCNAVIKASSKVAIVRKMPKLLPAHSSCIDAAFRRGAVEAIIQHVLTIVLLICFGRAVFTDPGSVPDEPKWLPEYQYARRGPEEIGAEGECSSKGQKAPIEKKHNGARRFCKWCNRFKPDRAHHCRVCRSCVLRMDHHCPWIANCVGFRNHKYFFLLIFYSLLDCTFIVATVSESLQRSIIQETHFTHRFLIVFCMTLSVMMGVLLFLFFIFHAWLMMRATTTIEFCEKTYRDMGRSHRGSSSSAYDRSPLDNIRAVLGPNVLLWFLPMALPEGDGLSFKVSEDSDSDAETTGLLSKRKQRGSPKCNDLAPSYQATSTDDIKSPIKGVGAGASDGDPEVGKAQFAQGQLLADGEAAPEVTAGEASIS